MNKTIIITLLTGMILGAGTLKVLAGHPTPAAAATIVETAEEVPALSHQQKAWLGMLEWCESRGNPAAINKKDRDNTPSYGILQFKPGTFALFAKSYGLASTTNYMDPDAQEAIVTQMILRGGIDWAQQFPACTAKYGTPPLSPKR